MILLGHSYGGAVITEAGTHERVRHLVYLCAFPLTENETCQSAAADDDTRAWALARSGPQPMITLGQSPGAVAWRSKPSTYVVCTDDMIIHPELQRILAGRCTQSVEWPTSHSPFLSRPELVAELLVGLAGDAAPG